MVHGPQAGEVSPKKNSHRKHETDELSKTGDTGFGVAFVQYRLVAFSL